MESSAFALMKTHFLKIRGGTFVMGIEGHKLYYFKYQSSTLNNFCVNIWFNIDPFLNKLLTSFKITEYYVIVLPRPLKSTLLETDQYDTSYFLFCFFNFYC